MANYNTFVVMDTETRKPELVTSSARKANSQLCKGKRVEIWNENERVSMVYAHQAHKMKTYIDAERDYLRLKQMDAEVRNAHRKSMRA